jgi:hypothetical protein
MDMYSASQPAASSQQPASRKAEKLNNEVGLLS